MLSNIMDIVGYLIERSFNFKKLGLAFAHSLSSANMYSN